MVFVLTNVQAVYQAVLDMNRAMQAHTANVS